MSNYCMRLKEEHKIVLIGILLVVVAGLQIWITNLSDKNIVLYQALQDENIRILKSYGAVNYQGINYLNLNSTVAKLFSWRQGDKPLGEAIIKSNSLYHELLPQEQIAWGDRTLFEYYFTKSNQLANQIDKQYEELDQFTKDVVYKTTVYNKRIKDNSRLINILSLISILILFMCILLYGIVLNGISNRLNKKNP